jgi:predicted MFS family arabinose efflux permease
MGIALGLFALGTFISAFAPTLLLLDVLRFATGAAAAGVIPVVLAFVGDAVPYEQRQAALGRVVSVASLGGVLSAAMGGVIASVLSWRAIFVVYGLVALVVAAVLVITPVTKTQPPSVEMRGVLTPYVALWRSAGRRALALYALVFLEGFTTLSTFGYLGALLFERDQFSYALIGALLTINGVGSLITGRIVGPLVNRIGERGMLLAGGTLMIVAFLVVGLRPTLIFFPVAMLLSGAGFVLAHSTLQARATELVPAQRGTAVALFAFALFLGSGLGTYLAGLVIEGWGYMAALLGTAVALAVFTISALPLLRIAQGQGRDDSLVHGA